MTTTESNAVRSELSGGARSEKLSKKSLATPPKNVAVPTYDRSSVTQGIVHLGVGGFHRSHEALYIEELLQSRAVRDWAICGVGIMPRDEEMNKALRSQDFLYTLVERSGAKDTARVIGSITEHIFGVRDSETVFERMTNPATRIVSMTATEGGYCFNQGTGEFDETHPGVVNDLKNPLRPQTIFGYLSEALDRRRKAGLKPFTVLSCDNLQGNGHITRKMMLSYAALRSKDLAQWIADTVHFPNSMVDRITPVTTETEREFVRTTFGIEDAFPVVAESFRQWVIEDDFGNGRPPLEEVGAQFVSEVAPFEKMKIRLLNATHSAMGYLGYLCGYRFIDEIARAPEFVPYLRAMMDKEVTPLVGSIPGIDLTWYKNSLMERFSNRHIKDQALRICMDGSAKMPKFILPSIREQLELGGPIRNLTLCVASWIRFLGGRDEEGKEIPLDDPIASRLKGVSEKAGNDPEPFLALSEIFGDLSSNPRFVGEVKLLVESLYKNGARETLRLYGTVN